MAESKYEPGAIKRGPNGEVATKTRLDDNGPGGVQSWIIVDPTTGLVQHAHTNAVSSWGDIK